MASEVTHKECVTRALKWVRSNHVTSGRCAVAFSELASLWSEVPDVFGMRRSGNTRGDTRSLIIECKISRSDFLLDSKKNFRRHPELGYGQFRYYFCPQGLLQPEEMPEGWGLLWYRAPRNRVLCVKEPTQLFNTPQSAANDCRLVYSLLMRAKHKGLLQELTTPYKP